MAAAGRAVKMWRKKEGKRKVTNREKNWKNFTNWLRNQMQEQTMKIQLIWDLKIGDGSKDLRKQSKASQGAPKSTSIVVSDEQVVHHTWCTSPSGSGMEEIFHLWSTWGAAQEVASFCLCAPDTSEWFPVQEAELTQKPLVGYIAPNKKIPEQPTAAPLSSLPTAPTRPSSISPQVR